MHIDIVIRLFSVTMESLKNISFTYHQDQKCAFIANKTDPIAGSPEFNDHGRYLPDTIMTFPIASNPQKWSRREVNGLCQSCDLIATCGWYRDDAVIFHCEHYQ
jgi:hypothetical protein